MNNLILGDKKAKMIDSTSNYKMKPIHHRQQRVDVKMNSHPVDLDAQRQADVASSVHLTKLSPKNMKVIKKPLLKRSTQLYKSGVRGALLRPKFSTTEVDDSEVMESLLRNMKPTLDQPERQSTQLKESMKGNSDDNKFSTTFGFSHGVSKGQGGVMVRRGVAHKHASPDKTQQVADAAKERRQMQICFSIASKASTMTQNVESYSHLMPSLENVDRDLEKVDSRTFQNAPNGLASQFRMMEEIARSCRETPITVQESDSTSHFQPQFSPRRDQTQRSLGFRKPDAPLQLFTYLAKQKKKRRDTQQPQKMTFAQHQSIMRKLLMEQNMRLAQQEAQAKGIKDQQKSKQFSATVPFIGNNTTNTFQSPGNSSTSDFGRLSAPFKPPQEDIDVPRRSLFQHLDPGKSRLPSIVSFTPEGNLQMQQTFFSESKQDDSGKNPGLPVQLSRKVSLMFQDEPPAKKIQLPPQATITFFDEADQTIKQAQGSALPQEQAYQPKWKKVDNSVSHFQRKHQSVPHNSVTNPLLIEQGARKTVNLSAARSRKNSNAVGHHSRNTNFMITSPSAVNKTMTEIINNREKCYMQNFGKKVAQASPPFKLLHGTQVQTKKLKKTLSRFQQLKTQKDDVSQTRLFSPVKPQMTKTEASHHDTYYETFFSSFSPGATVVDGEMPPPEMLKLVDEDRAALNQLVWQMQNSKKTSAVQSPMASHETQKMPLISPAQSSDSALNQLSHEQLATLQGQALPMVAFAQWGGLDYQKETMHIISSEVQQAPTLGQKEINNDELTQEQLINVQESCDVPLPEKLDTSVGEASLIIDEDFKQDDKSPSFLFAGRTSGTQTRQSPSDLLKSIEKASPQEIKRLIRETIQCQNERHWNESNLKVSGKNMGYPDHLKNLSFAQQQALLTLNSDEDESPRMAAFKAGKHGNHLLPASPQDSHKDLNADLLMQNIYRAEEFFDSAPALSRNGQTIVALVRTETQALHPRTSNSESPGEHKSDNQKARATSRTHNNMKLAEASMQINAKTPDSIRSQQDNQTSNQNQTMEDGKDAQELLIGGSVIAGELDVDSVYLRSSVQGGLDEQNLKTVFQKRAKPSGDTQTSAVQILEGIPRITDEAEALQVDDAISPKTVRAPSNERTS